MAHPSSEELLQRRQRPTEPLDFLRENDRCPITAASLRVDGSMLANIVVAFFAPVEVATLMAIHDWQLRLPLRVEPLGTCPFRLVANNTYHRPHHRAREIKRQLQDCQIKGARAVRAALLLLLL